MVIGGKCVVSMQFKLTNSEGEELDASTPEQPLVYLHGTESLIPGLENALEGKEAGDDLQVTIKPEDAYGMVNPEMIQVVPRSAFQEVKDIEAGMQFEARDAEGNAQRVLVQAVSGDNITINANHPLAGQTLNFDVTVEEVREASAEELDHGHVHGADHVH